MAGSFPGIALINGTATNGVPASLWLKSRFAGQPAQGAAAPSGSADYGPVTSDPAFGATGAFTITGVADGDYYLLLVTGGVNYWSGPYSVEDDADLVHIAGTETITGAKTFSGAATFNSAIYVEGGTIPGGLVVDANTSSQARIYTNNAGTALWVNAPAGVGTAHVTLDDGSGNLSTGGNITGGTVTASGTGGAQPGPSAGQVVVRGAGSGYVFGDRTGSQYWQWYGSGSKARLYNGSSDVFSVDASGNGTVAGSMTVGSGFTMSAGTMTLPTGSVPQAAVSGLSNGVVDPVTSQVITGIKTFDNDVNVVGGEVVASALATPSAPVVTPTGTTGSTTYQYEVVATSYDGRDGIPSAVGQTTTGNATLSSSNYNALSWPAVTGAASYKVLRNFSGTYKLLAGGITGTTLNDQGQYAGTTYSPSASNPGGEAWFTALTANSLSAASSTLSGALTAKSVQANYAAGGISAGRFLGVVAAATLPTGGPYNAGDFVFDTTGRQAVCLTAGSPGTWRWVGAGTWRARMHQAAAQNLAGGASTLAALDTVDYDPASMCSTSTHLITIPVAGYYLLAFGLEAQLANNPQDFTAFAGKNGANAVVQGNRIDMRGGTAGDLWQSNGTDVASLAAGDTIGLYGFNGGGNPMAIQTVVWSTFLTVHFLSGA